MPLIATLIALEKPMRTAVQACLLTLCSQSAGGEERVKRARTS